MSLRICVLGSGSLGNCTYVATRTTGLLIDAGLSGCETLRRIEAIGVSASDINAICLSHEHTDHINGLNALCRRLGVHVYANNGTVDAVRRTQRGNNVAWRIFTAGSPFKIGDITVEAFSVCHDAYDPVGFVMSADGVRLGAVTDMGMATALVRECLRDCTAIIVEANHDEQMLRDAPRPWSLKRRIAGRHGHLSNKHAAELVAEIAGPRLRHVFLAHLSNDCNRPELASMAVKQALSNVSSTDTTVEPTCQDRVSAVWSFPPE